MMHGRKKHQVTLHEDPRVCTTALSNGVTLVAVDNNR